LIFVGRSRARALEHCVDRRSGYRVTRWHSTFALSLSMCSGMAPVVSAFPMTTCVRYVSPVREVKLCVGKFAPIGVSSIQSVEPLSMDGTVKVCSGDASPEGLRIANTELPAVTCAGKTRRPSQSTTDAKLESARLRSFSQSQMLFVFLPSTSGLTAPTVSRSAYTASRARSSSDAAAAPAGYPAHCMKRRSTLAPANCRRIPTLR
jgi:hypothetical protein